MKVTKEDSLLHLFTKEGKTFTFHNVTLIVDNESTLVFDYGAQSDGRGKRFECYKNNIVGFSMTK